MKQIYKTLVLSLLLYSPVAVFAQSAPIAIDANFNDWTSDLTTITDVSETLSGVDMLEMQVSNDDEFLFIRLKANVEFKLCDNTIPHDLRLYLDTDNNESTGFPVQTGYGAEFEIVFNQLRGISHFNDPGDTVRFLKFSFRQAPTVSSNEYEIAIKRSAVPDNVNQLFTSSTIKILLVNKKNGDIMPEQGEVFSYTFDETPVPPYNPVEINKENTDHIRIVAYNVKLDGFIKWRAPYLDSIVRALKPDIIGFSECHDTGIDTVKNLLDLLVPTGTTEGWFVDKKNSGDLITASRWPIISDWNYLERQYPALIDLPESYETDLLFTNAHLSPYSSNDDLRQEQADQYISFILDAKTEGGSVTLPEGTPFVYAGDLNLVGLAQQLRTLLTGDIQNTGLFGAGEAPDWDGTDVVDNMALQTEKRMNYTWRNDKKDYPPGKLDFMIYSDAVLTAEKSFVLQTEMMSQERLDLYDLDKNATGTASDHFPVVSDFSIHPYNGVTGIQNRTIYPRLNHKIYPNPLLERINITFSATGEYKVILTDVRGNSIFSDKMIKNSTTIDTENLKPGIYFIAITDADGNKEIHRVMKL
ncbi:MAG: T9SS type A sorting domain-containing protein [Bacteroidota bacterium]